MRKLAAQQENPYSAPKARLTLSRAHGPRYHWLLRCSIWVVTATSFFFALAYALALGVLLSVGTDVSPLLSQSLLAVLLVTGALECGAVLAGRRGHTWRSRLRC